MNHLALILLVLPNSTSGFSSCQRNYSRRYHGCNNAGTPLTNSFCQTSTSLKNDLRDEIENAAQRRAYENRARGEGVGETAAGAILGGLLCGPFGALVSFAILKNMLSKTTCEMFTNLHIAIISLVHK